MAKILCLEKKYNGRYCKNYPVKNKNKCNLHYEYQDNTILLGLIMTIITIMTISTISYISYISHNYNVREIEIMLKAYFLQLYKIDKNMIFVYIKSLNIVASYYYNIICLYVCYIIYPSPSPYPYPYPYP